MDAADYYQPNMAVELSTSRDALDYNMCHPQRGICLIIENSDFSKNPATRHLSKRTGSDVDCDQIKTLFSRLGFTIIEHKDLKASAVRCALKQISMLDHSQYDCFACFVLTHGDHGSLYAKDGRYGIDYIFCDFLGDKCPTLVGKPKLFFIQACQGGRVDPGVVVSANSVDGLDVATYFKIPTYADFLIAYSTLPGFYSFRNTEKGSWFINALVQVFSDYHNSFDLLSMMTMICHQVAYNYQSNTADPQLSGLKQVPCITSMLTRRVFLFPKCIQL